MKCPKCETPLPKFIHDGMIDVCCKGCGFQFRFPIALLAANSVKEAGFVVTLTGDRHFMVKLDGVAIAEVEVWIEGNQSVVLIEQKVFGDLRPKIDEIICCINDLPLDDLFVIKAR